MQFSITAAAALFAAFAAAVPAAEPAPAPAPLDYAALAKTFHGTKLSLTPGYLRLFSSEERFCGGERC